MFSLPIPLRGLICLSCVLLLLTFQVFEWTIRSPAQLPSSGDEPSHAYHLVEDYSGSSFFDGFNYEDAPDPTHGHVLYQSRKSAQAMNLTYIGNDGIAYLHTESYAQAPQGRPSIRISTKRTFTRGLFVLDLLHMPVGCGTWPAFWTTAVNGWPRKGEIDILEGVNLEVDNAMTLHTGAGCRQPKERQMRGTAETMNCDVKAADQWPNQGCGVKTQRSFGHALNERGGAVIVTEWTSKTIKIWQFFDRAALPADLASTSPDPSTWDVLPDALFQDFECPIDKIFRDHVVLINTSLCGDWAGNTYGTSTCPGTSCNAYVSGNPQAFKDAYWAIRSLRVYQR
ncbi:endo-beta-glucanase [Protomyces lactucae-debilis]|uniref:Endo-beta-glucanase n=1 Tax=Protomyces lactucae-debilis TaxID=2754530 RepID=A0A1Y2EUT0_PROLT|nr:endo-beta-glucanase [Protomyces lactucae-debilis]ORY74605.1 endo-beta-glucanase [Protomyces lactucae-debilis]